VSNKKKADPNDYLLGGLKFDTKSKFKVAESFLEFCDQIGVKLSRAQLVACAIAYDGVQPEDLRGSDRELARKLFGDIESITDEQRRVFVAVAGARAGKTYVLIALRILHLALTVPLDDLAPGEVASAPIIAPDMDQACKPLRFIQGAVRNHPELLKMVVGKADAAESIEFARDGKSVEIVVRAASGKGRTGRGSNLVGAALEETAFFRDAGSVVNDQEQFDAITIRAVLPGSQIIIVSTPWAQTGLLYDFFSQCHPNPECAGLPPTLKLGTTCLAMHSPTLVFRDSPILRQVVEQQYQQDSENARREYGAQFMGAGTESFFDPIVLSKSVDSTYQFPTLPEPGDRVMAGIDLGFTKNSSALVVSHLKQGIIRVAQIIEKKPQEGAALQPSEVCREFGEEIRRHGGSYFMADQHYKQTAIEVIGKLNLGFVDAPMSPAESFIKTRTLMREGLVKIPNHPRLLRQLKEVTWRKNSGGNITIILQKWPTGEHGDIVSAFVLSIFQQSGQLVLAPKPKVGTPEADAIEVKEAQERRRQAQLRNDQSLRQNWTPGDRSR